jgi:hypothetical protein
MSNDWVQAQAQLIAHVRRWRALRRPASLLMYVRAGTLMKFRAAILCGLFAASLLSPMATAGQQLTRRDSAAIGEQIAMHIAPSLRPSNGADSSNAVCVKLVSDVGGAFLRSLDSSLYAGTGGALVAPLKGDVLRSVRVTALKRSRDTVFATVQTSSGGLRRGETQSGTVTRVPVVLSRSRWQLRKVNLVMVGDGYVHADRPVPPVPPKCL